MIKYEFAKNPEQAAKDFAANYKTTRPKLEFEMIPHDLVSSAEFWATMVKENPQFIASVPLEVRYKKSFADQVDHVKFYRFLPKEFITVEEYEMFKASRPFFACGPLAELNCHNEFVWLNFDGSGSWIRLSQVSPTRIIESIGEFNSPEKILPEFWNQGLADAIWKSAKAIIAFDAIPKEFVRPEWEELMEILKRKRYPLFKMDSTLNKPEKLAEYWGQFKTAKEMWKALEVEQLVNRCQNPYGYSITVTFGSSDEVPDLSAYFAELLKVIRPILDEDADVSNAFVELYRQNYAKQLPREMFDKSFVLMDDEFDYALDDYRMCKYLLESACTEVERLEAEENMTEAMKELKRIVLSYVTMDYCELEAFIEEAIND